jgi:hypothetical protein
MEGKFKMISSSDVNVLKIQKLVNSNTYDGFKLSFDPDVLTSCLTMNNCQGPGGCFRAVPPQIGLEAGIGFYKYPDARVVDAGDMWVAGINCWQDGDGFTIGAHGVGSCLNISKEGNVHIPLILSAQEIMVDTLKAETTEYLNIDDNVIITGNLTVNGTMTGAVAASNPFYIAGKIAANGDIMSSKGRHSFDCVKSGTSYYITPSPSFGNVKYVISATPQVDSASALCRISSSTMTNDTFVVATYVNNSQAACMFHFTVIS